MKAETGLPILVDGAQSAGVIPVEAGAFDYYAISCQKWLCGPDVDRRARRRATRTSSASRCRATSRRPSTSPTARSSPATGAERFDSGWIGTPSLAGLSAALDVAPGLALRAGGRDGRARAATALAERFEVVTKPGQAGLVSFRPDGDPTELVERSASDGVDRPRAPGPEPDPRLVRLLDERGRSRAPPRRPRLVGLGGSSVDVAAVRSPSSPAIGRIASITKRMWSSSSTPSSSAPL